MKKILVLIVTSSLVIACSNKKKEKQEAADKRIVLRSDTTNTVRLTDTLLIPESTCRGCAYEMSTDFSIDDSLGIIKLYDVITRDNNPENMEGGSVSKSIILVPQKTGTTTFKLYKFWGPETKKSDSAHFSSYTVEVK